MSRNTGNKPAAARGNPLLTGILIGMVIGVGMAAGMAWYLMKSPSPFMQKELPPPKPQADIPKPRTSAAEASQSAAASGVAEGKPRFEFYKVLTDKQDAAVAPAKPAEKQAKPPAMDNKTDNKAAVTQGPYFLQAASYSSVDDAEKLKAKLAMLGVEAYIQTATIPDKGVWHRVRMGPYRDADEMNNARTLLKQNGIDATHVHAQ